MISQVTKQENYELSLYDSLTPTIIKWWGTDTATVNI